jgi:hypothetical protein
MAQPSAADGLARRSYRSVRVAVEESDPDLFTATGRIGWLFGRELERLRDVRIGRASIRLAA